MRFEQKNISSTNACINVNAAQYMHTKGKNAIAATKSTPTNEAIRVKNPCLSNTKMVLTTITGNGRIYAANNNTLYQFGKCANFDFITSDFIMSHFSVFFKTRGGKF